MQHSTTRILNYKENNIDSQTDFFLECQLSAKQY